MKTILEWLEWAKEQGYEWADAAIRNYDPNFVPIEEANSLIDAIGNAFSWGNSPEKYEYWEGVCESLRAAEETASLEALTKSLRKLNNAIGATKASYEEQLTEVKPTSLESLIEDLGKLNSAIGNLEHNETLKEPYRTQVYEATKASYEEQLAEVKSEIAKAIGLKGRKLIGWVVQNEDGGYSRRKVATFVKEMDGWVSRGGIGWSDITPEEAAALCDRLPKWSDDEPTPVYEK